MRLVNQTRGGAAVSVLLVLVLVGGLAAALFFFGRAAPKQAEKQPDSTEGVDQKESTPETPLPPLESPEDLAAPVPAQPAVADSSAKKTEPDYSQVGTILAKMSVEKALKVLQEMPDKEVVAVLKSVPERTAAQLLEALPAERIATLLEALAAQTGTEGASEGQSSG